MAIAQGGFEALGGSILNDDARRCGKAGRKSTGVPGDRDRAVSGDVTILRQLKYR
jgi:hypothetical protein